MAALNLTNRQARRLLLAHQGLWPPYRLEGKEGILRYIRRVGCIQFDPIDIVSCNHELVLQSRVADFRPGILHELLYQDRQLLDGWDKNMSIYGVEDWPCFRRQREAVRTRSGRSAEWITPVLPQIREALETRGPLSSADLDFDQVIDWTWAPARLSRAALEHLYFSGELVVHHRVRSRRVYDFAHRQLPEVYLNAPDPNETEVQYQDWHVLRRIGSLGLLWDRPGDAWLGLYEVKSPQRSATLARLLERGQLMEARVEGLDRPLYLRSADWPAFERVLDAPEPAPEAAVLAPLDNLLWDRRLLKDLFDFDYRWEVYKPVDERRYGYYVLPILYGDRFVARFEPGRDRKGRAFSIKNWWWEPDVVPTVELQAALCRWIARFMRYLETEHLQIAPEAVARAGLEWLADGS